MFSGVIMGMHEYEDLVEMSIRTLEKSPNAARLKLRDVFYTLYEFQGMFDTGNTYFRVMPILLKHRAFYRLEPKDYPDAARLGTMFKDSSDWLEVIPANPDEEFDARENPVVAYWFFDRNPSEKFRQSGVVDRWDEPRIFVPAESSVVPALVERGALPASEGTPSQRLSFEQVAALVAQEAETQGDTDLIAYWYLLLPSALLWIADDDGFLEPIQSNPHVLELLQIAERTGANTLQWDYGSLRRPDPDDLLDLEDDGGAITAFMKWWFKLESTH
jgi:hypothetical protein